MLIALMLVVLVTTLASTMLWLQNRALRVQVAERARSQASWILAGALDWARLILREDARTIGPDHLGEPWAVPLAEARLSSFLAIDKNNTDEGLDAFLSGQIEDAQSRYNLINLTDAGKPVPSEVNAFRRLLDGVGVSPSYASQIASQLAAAQSATSGPNSRGQDGPVPAPMSDPDLAPLMPRRVEQLTWFGLPVEATRRMARFVTILPRPTPVNLNTASATAMLAAVDNLDLGSAQRLVQTRQRTPFKSLDDAKAALGGNFTLDPKRVSVSSSFFEVRGRLRSDDAVLEEYSLVERRGMDVFAIQTLRYNPNTPPP
jgi:general secretion pathway protein K